MNPSTQTACVAAIMFVAALTRSTFGFGEALVAMPLLSLFINIETATALVALNSIFNSIVILATAREATDWQGGWRLLFASVCGIPVGVYLLTHIPAVWVKTLLAIVILLFSLHGLVRRHSGRLKNDNWAFPFGFIGGLLGGAYNTAGPPMVIFGTLRGWSPAQFRSTLQGVFLPNASFVLAMHYQFGLWSSEVFRFAKWTLPLVLVTVPLGYWLNHRIHPEHFQRFLYAILIVLAVTLLVTTLFR